MTHELIEEKWRSAADIATDQTEIRRFEGPVAQQMIAERAHHRQFSRASASAIEAMSSTAIGTRGSARSAA